MDNYPPVYLTPPDAFYQTYSPLDPLPLHAPIPLPVQTPVLYSMDSSAQQPYIDPEIPRELVQEQPINFDYGSTHVIQSTFPTPSELLAELTANGLPATNDEFAPDGRSESARKARRRAMAKSVGFIPTDPDTISSHEKKRHYLECLEQYVMYLHQQLELVGSQPIPLERVANYRGLSSRSIRTLLVHMENTTRRLHLRTLDEEQRFIALRDMVYKRTSTQLE
ncbi:hypothetical protein BYT27DRAFT_7189545 [Phlegmacium glaucopus]|nr:hypothetical protein BYT27DRAFT_7189545 [Phlegmacium glaucopus]